MTLEQAIALIAHQICRKKYLRYLDFTEEIQTYRLCNEFNCKMDPFSKCVNTCAFICPFREFLTWIQIKVCIYN